MRVLCLFVSLLLASATAHADKLEVGDTAPAFTLKPLNGEAAKVKIVSLEDYVGPERSEKKKAVLVAFTSSACEPCKRDLSFFKTLNDEYKSKDFFVLVVDTDKDDEGSAKVTATATTAGANFPLLGDRFGVVSSRYKVAKAPVAYLIDENQKVAKAAVSYDDTAYPDLLNAIKQVLGVAEAEPVPATLQPFMKPVAKPAPSVISINSTPDAEPEPAATDDKGKKKRVRSKKAVQAAAPAADDSKGPKRVGHKAATP
jgi:peroxiredoxin